jgi:REP element-mobilizing transposase RayT
MSTAHVELYVHLVWGTMGRAPWITQGVEGKLHALLIERCQGLGCPPLAISGVEDHVHVLAALSPTVAIAALVKQLKGSSAYALARSVPEGAVFRWQKGYGAFTLRKTDLPTVKAYVLRQKEHHASRVPTPEWEPPTEE